MSEAQTGDWYDDPEEYDDDGCGEPGAQAAPEPEPAPRPCEPGPPRGGFPEGPCWSCDGAVPAGTAECPACLNPRAHLVLVFETPGLWELRTGPDRPLRLGRDPAWAPRTAAGLAEFRRVSRRHATVGMEPSGTAWVEEEPSGTRNGTWLNDRRLPPGGRAGLRDGDVLRLEQRVRCTVRLRT